MKENRNLIIMIAVYVLVLILIGICQPREIDWRQTFSSTDKIPFGTYILKDRLHDIFGSSKVQATDKTIFKTLHKTQYTNTNYILIEPRWQISKADLRELINFANEGNNVFIASLNIPFTLLDTLGLYQKFQMPYYFSKAIKADTSRSLLLTLGNQQFGKDSSYGFESSIVPQYFAPVENDTTTIDANLREPDSTRQPLVEEVAVLSSMHHGRPVFIKLAIGKGHFYLHSYPLAFTNYYMVKDSTRGYAERCLSYLPAGNVIWDEHYKNTTGEGHMSTLGFIAANDSLRWAYNIAMAFIIIFVLFSVRRRQRVIPVVVPFRNATLDFTETVGRLYFNRGDHKNIAEKKIRHFMEYVRSRYYLDTQELDTEFIEKLAAKSAMERGRVQYMVEVMRSLLNKQEIADTELIQLNELIEYFKSNGKE